MFLLRVSLPDRPGSLGLVAGALGEVGADIAAMEIVERGEGVVVDDFMVALPDGARPDLLVGACAVLPDVEVLWVSNYPASWGLASDIDALEQMLADPDRAVEMLTASAPSVFHSAWALVVDASGAVTHRSDLAPTEAVPLAPFGDLTVPHVADLPAGWVPGWGANVVAVTPLANGHALLLGRPGPTFHATELARLRHLVLLAGAEAR